MPPDPAGREPSGELPLDSDLGAAADRPLHVRPAALALVALGGVVGTGVRAALTEAFPTAGFPWTVFVVNLVGSFALGALLEGLVRRGDDSGRRRTVRLLVGTGMIGGFTTYSAFALDAALLFRTGDAATAIAYLAATVLIGAVATWAGIVVASLHRAGSEGAR
ncbi:hypothetical protein DDQ50_15805 [Amnibacterium flavum]|uniref:Fluoride-specific ion channel FluC n=1 Tax=Amnibacterium flavum TaxID=2173173 RepID=A0A2V1HPE7_9MICO|nr:hypothetical protein DDQ50_15805 [Amnibacterium flavum]